MLNFNYGANSTKMFGSMPRLNIAKITIDEKKQLNKMEQNFISQARAKNEKVAHDENSTDEKVNISELDPNDPYAGLTEEDATKLEEMRNKYTSDIIQKRQSVYDSEYDKACNEHNKVVSTIKAKCEKIANMIALGKNVAKSDITYLSKNNPSGLSSAVARRSMAEMFQEKDDEKPKKIVNKDDKNYEDLEWPKPQFASHDLTESELRGMPTASDLPNYESDYASSSAQVTQNNVTYSSSATAKVATSNLTNFSISV